MEDGLSKIYLILVVVIKNREYKFKCRKDVIAEKVHSNWERLIETSKTD